MKRILFFSPVAALLLIAASSPNQAETRRTPRIKEAVIENQSTTVTTQGTYTLIDYPNATSTQLWGVNSRGEMIGVYVSADKVTHGFLYSHGQFKSIDYPGSALTLANGINAQGDIVGEYALTATGPHHGFVLSGSRFTTVDYPDGSSTGVVGLAANGDMVGYFGSPLRGYLLQGDRFTAIDYPDRMIFDLDPAPDIGFGVVKVAAQDLRQRLQKKGLESVLKCTGGKGLHVTVPLSGKDKWPAVKSFSAAVAAEMVAAVPEAYVATMTKAKRTGKIFIDTFRNDYTATAIADYGVRARPGAPVAMPLNWEDLEGVASASQFTMKDVLGRLKEKGRAVPARPEGQTIAAR